VTYWLKKLQLLEKKMNSSNASYWGVICLIYLVVFISTRRIACIHLTGFNYLISIGMENHNASFLSHLTQILIYDTVLLLLTITGMKIYGISLSEIGWKKPEFKKIAGSAAILTGFVFLWGIIISLYKTGNLDFYDIRLNKNWADLGNTSVYIFLFTVVVNSPTEEIFYRGFLQTALEKKLSSTYAIPITAFLFSFTHVWGAKASLQRFISGIIYGLLKKWGNSLWNPISAHLCKNAIASWLSIKYI